MNKTKFLKEPRIIMALLALTIAFIAIGPTPVPNNEGVMELDTNILLGLDLQGGVRALIEPEDASQATALEVISVLDTRLNAFGLQEMNLKAVQVEDKWLVQLEIAGADEAKLKELLEKQGKFDATINRVIDIEDGEGTLVLDDLEYYFEFSNEVLMRINETEKTEVAYGEKFMLDGITFNYTNSTNKSVVLEATVFQGKDVVQVFSDATRARITPTGTGSWSFEFQVSLSKESAERFAKITKNIADEKGSGLGKRYLASDLNLYLDDTQVNSLKIASSTRGMVLTQPLISGPGETKEEALDEMKSLQSILKSGALPTQIEIVHLSTLSPSLGKEFVLVSIYAILAAICAVSVVIFLRYRDPRFVIPIVLTSAAEVFLIFGFAALVHWTIDLAAIAGIIAAIGTGVDSQILIVDESRAKTKEIVGMKRRLKNAFFIIFVSAATTIAAMLPLLSVGAGSVRGFAFTTIVGMLIGVLLTRPVFAKVIEYLRRAE